MATINNLNSATWKKLSEDPSKSCVRSVNKKFHLSFPPFYVNDVRKSVMTVIERRLIRYEPDLGGILAGCGKVDIIGPKAEIMFNLAEIHVDVQGEFFIFNPSVGSMLTGIVNKKSVGHIGCLVHGLFNISLPKPFSLPAQSWQGSQANLNDEVVFTITRSDFQSQIPYIEGTIVEVRAHTSDATITRERKCSDSGVSIGSDDAVSTKKTSKAGKKLSLSKNVDISTKTVAIDDEHERNKLTSPVRNKRKHNEDLTPSAIETAAEETPRKKSKKSETSEDQDDDGDMMNLVSNLFADVTKKVMTRGPADKKKSKKIANLSVDSSVQSSGKKKSNREELGNTKIKTEVQSSDEDIIKELMFSVQKTTPRAVSSAKTSKKKLSMSQIVENNGSPATTPQCQKEPIAMPKPVNDSSAKKKKKSESNFDSESISSAGSSSSRQKGKKKSNEDIIKELVSSVRESTPVKDSPKPSKKKLSISQTFEDNNSKTPVTGSSNRSSTNFSVIFETPKSNANTSVSSNKSSKSSKPPSIKKEEASTDRRSSSVHESLINSILKSVQKKK